MIAVLLPTILLGVMLALGRYEEHLFTDRHARRRHARAARHTRR